MPLLIYFVLLFCFFFGIGFQYVYIKFRCRFDIYMWPILGFLLPLPLVEEKYIWRPIIFCGAYIVGVLIGISFLRGRVKPLPDPVEELIKAIKSDAVLVVKDEDGKYSVPKEK